MASGRPLTFGFLLRRARQAAGLTQVELAERAGISPSAVTALERGVNRAPHLDTVLRLADALALQGPERTIFMAVARGHTPLPHASFTDGHVAEPGLRSSPALVGRAGELGVVDRHLSGEGAPLLLLTGEPGIGKSRLLDEVALCASARGWTVMRGGCHRRSGQEPYAPFVGALQGYLRLQPTARQRTALHRSAWLLRLLPELVEQRLVVPPDWRLGAEQGRRLMFEAVGRFCANVAGPAGTVLLLDDLQWAGIEAVDLLAFLVRASAELPYLRVIAAHRDSEVHGQHPLAHLVADLGREGLARALAVGPLAALAADALLEALLAGRETLDPARRQEVLTLAEGVPFFLISFAQTLLLSQPNGQRTDVERSAVCGPVDLPWTVAQSIQQRVALLPEAARAVLAVAAVAGRLATSNLLLAVADLPEQEAVAALAAAQHARLLVEEQENRYVFVHAFVREAVLAALSGAQRRRLHRMVAEYLEGVLVSAATPPAQGVSYHR